MLVGCDVQVLDFYSSPYSFKNDDGVLVEGVTFYLEIYDFDAPSGSGKYLKLKVDNKSLEERKYDDPEFMKSVKGKKVFVNLNLVEFQGNVTAKVVEIRLEK